VEKLAISAVGSDLEVLARLESASPSVQESLEKEANPAPLNDWLVQVRRGTFDQG